MKKTFALLLIICAFTLTACGSKETTINYDEATIKEYSEVYESDDSSKILINKDEDNFKVDISLYRLAEFKDCNVDEVEDEILYISGTDPNGEIIKFSFDYKTNQLNVQETTWNLLNVGDSFVFNKK